MHIYSSVTLVPTSQIIWNYNLEDLNILQWKPFVM